MAAQDELQAWYNGTVNGGPNGDGRYPLTYKDGTVHLVLCPAAQAVATADDTSAPQQFAQDAEASATAAQTAQTAAEAAASSATASANTATTKAGEASASAAAAAASKTAAATSETNAAASKTAAATSATNAATSATNASNSATTATTAKTDAQAARDLAQKWASNPVDSVVSGGLYSAYHWAQKAMATVSGLLVYRGAYDASGNVYPAGPTKGDFWKISVAGVVGGVDLAVGDQIIYNGAGWDKIDNTEQVTAVAGKVGNVTLSKADVGLGSVDNTSDLAKPISTATQTALNAKVSLTGNNTLTGSNNFVGNSAFSVDGAGSSRITMKNDGIRRALIADTDEVLSLVAYKADGGTPTGQLDIGTGGLKYSGASVWHSGNFTPSNKMDSWSPIQAGGYWTVKPYGVTYDDGSYVQAYYDGNNRLFKLFGRDSSGIGFLVNIQAGNLAAAAITASSVSANSVTIGGNAVWNAGNFNPADKANLAGAAFTNTVSVPYLIAGDGNGTASIRVGNDTNLWDVNVANTFGVKGAQDPTKGFIRFGSDTNGLGWDGSKLAYGASTLWHSGNFDPSTKANANNAAFTGTMTLPTGAGTCTIAPGTGDGASYTTYNFKISSWWGIGFATYDGSINGFYDARAGRWDTKGGYRVNGQDVWYPGNFDPATKANLSGAAFTGAVSSVGLSLGSAVAPAASNVSRHLNLYGGTYGFSITGSTLNHVASTNAVHDFLSGSTVQQRIGTDARTLVKDANSATLTTQPRAFVQSADPGAAAADNDIWIW